MLPSGRRSCFRRARRRSAFEQSRVVGRVSRHLEVVHRSTSIAARLIRSPSVHDRRSPGVHHVDSQRKPVAQHRRPPPPPLNLRVLALQLSVIVVSRTQVNQGNTRIKERQRVADEFICVDGNERGNLAFHRIKCLLCPPTPRHETSWARTIRCWNCA